MGGNIAAGTGRRIAVALSLAALCGCGGGGAEQAPAPGFGMLSGQRVLVLPVQYVTRTAAGWIGGAANAEQAARQADSEITFALGEEGGRAYWVTPAEQVEVLRRRPSIEVNPYMLSADEARREGGDLKDVRDPLYGEIRMLAALFDTRFAVWPLEVYYEPGEEGAAGRVAIRTFLLDARSGDVLWYGQVEGVASEDPSSPGALAAAAQAFAMQVSP